MTTSRLLHHTPGACSRVVLNALEEIGLPYRERSVAILAGAQRMPEYLAINPKGKVPTLVDADGVVYTELPVITYHLALAQPEARLLPTDASGQVPLACLSDLTWLSGTLHPIIARMFRPTSLSVADPNGVKAIAYAEMNGHAAGVSSRLEGQRWWYGDDWSITDVMLNWVFSTAGQYGFPYADFPVLAAHRERVEMRPSFIRARACEVRARERDSLSLPSGFKL